MKIIDDIINNDVEPLHLRDKDMLKLFIRLYELSVDKSIVDNMLKQYSTPYLVLKENKGNEKIRFNSRSK